MNPYHAGSDLKSILRRMSRLAPAPGPRARRNKRRARPLLHELEQRRLLSVFGFNSNLAIDLPVDPTVQRAAQLPYAGQETLYRFTVDQPGLLSASVQAAGFQTTLSLLTEQGGLLIQSQAASAANNNPLIDQHLIPGTYYLDVLARTGGGYYVLSTGYTPSAAPLEPIPTGAGTGPYGIAHGDFTGNGIQDLAIVDQYNNDVLIELGNGDGTFRTLPPIPVGTGPSAIVAVDLDGDGRLDLVTANEYSNDLSILMGNGDGSFAPEERIAVGNGPNAIVAANLNGDRFSDLAVTDQLDNNVCVLLGTGNGTFRQAGFVSVGFNPTAIAAGDFNGHGRTDLVVGNDGSHSISLLMNNGDGTFQPERTLSISGGVSSVVTGDFNGDHQADIALADYASNTVSVFLGNGNGTFRPESRYSTGKAPASLVAADFTGDGHVDLATANYSSGSVSLLPGNGDGTFKPEKELPAGSGAQCLTAVALTGDGRLGMAVVNFVGQNLSILMGNGDGTFVTGSSPLPPISPAAVAVGDLNGDGIPDLVVGDDTASDIRIFLGRPDGTFQDPIVLATGARTYDVVLADFNGDHKLDIAAVNWGSNDVSVFLGYGDGTFQPEVRYPAGLESLYLTAVDLNHDGHLDIVTANWQSNDVSVFMGFGNGTFQPAVFYSMGDAPSGMIAVDLNGDGIPDLVTGNQFSNDISVRLGKGDGTFGPEKRYAAGDGPFYAIAGDFNGDGRPDIAVSDYNTGPPSVVAILVNNGDGTFQASSFVPVGDNPYRLAAADLNHDGKLDLVVTNDGSDDLSVLLGNGDATFQPERRYATGQGGYGLAIADLYRDGRLDLVTANYRSNDITVYRGLGDGTFQRMPTLNARSTQVSMATGDLSGDSFLDMAEVDPSANMVTIRLGNGDGSFRNACSYPVGDEPHKVLTADVNGDGRLDLIVANRGSHDVSVLLGNGDGTFQPQQRYPVGSLPCSMGIADFNEDGLPDIAVVDAGSDNVAILFNQGNGRFGAERRFLVGAEPSSLLVNDLNGDGHLDLVTANRSSADVSVLEGDGRGGFSEKRLRQPDWTPETVGLQPEVPGEPRSFVVIDGVAHTVTIVIDPLGTPAFVSFPSPVAASGAISFADFNGDGQQDVAVAQYETSQLWMVMSVPGGEEEEFVGPVTFSYQPAGMVAGDFNNDGKLDLAIASGETGQIEIRLGVGDGTFLEPQVAFSTVNNSIITADVYRNGGLDALVLNGKGQLVYRQGDPTKPGQFGASYLVNPNREAAIKDVAVLHSSSGVRAAILAQDFPVLLIEQSDLVAGYQVQQMIPLDPRLLASRVLTGDLDGDGRDDIVLLCRGTNQALIYYQDASGDYPYVPSRVLNLGFAPADGTLASLYGTRFLDIVVADEYSGDVAIIPTLALRDFGATILLPGGLGAADLQTINGQLVRHTSDQTISVLVGRFFAADHTDIVMVDHGTDRISILRQLPDGGFANPVFATSFQTGQGPIKAVAGDFDGDGQLELAILNQDGQNVTILQNDGAGHFTAPQTIDVGPRPTGIQARDLTGSGQDDLLVSNESGDLLVLLNKGDGTFAPYQRGTQVVTIASGDLAGNGQTEFVLTNQAQDQLSVQSLSGSDSFVQGRANGLLAPSDVKIVDLNRDGIPDLVVANSGANDILVYLGTGAGEFAPPQKFFTGTSPVAITVGDDDADGLPDLFVTNSGSNDISVFLSEGRGSNWSLMTGPRLSAGLDPVSTTLADVNADGIPDLLVVNQGSGTVEVLPGLGRGFFNDHAPRIFAADNSPIRAFVGHFDSGPGQGLLIVNSQSNDLTYYSNFMAPDAQARTLSSGGLFPIAALQGDFNSDGYSDLIVANSGDGTIALFVGSAGGPVLANTVTLPGSAHPAGIVLEGGTTGQLNLFVATQGARNLIPVSISFLATLSTLVATPTSAGSTAFTGHSPTGGPSGNLATLTLESSSGPSSESSSSASASAAFASTTASATSAAIGLGTASVMQSLTSLTGGSFSSLVSMLLEVDPTRVTEVQPLRSGEVAAVAVMLTVQELRVDRLDEQLRDEAGTEHEAGQPVTALLDLQSRDQVDTRQLLVERFISGVEDELGIPAPVQDAGFIVPGTSSENDGGLPATSGRDRGDRLPDVRTEPGPRATASSRLPLCPQPAETASVRAAGPPQYTGLSVSTWDAFAGLDAGSSEGPPQVSYLSFSVAAGVIAATVLRRPIARKVRKLAHHVGRS